MPRKSPNARLVAELEREARRIHAARVGVEESANQLHVEALELATSKALTPAEALRLQLAVAWLVRR